MKIYYVLVVFGLCLLAFGLSLVEHAGAAFQPVWGDEPAIASSPCGGEMPTEAANAGLTTCAKNYDFSQSLYATQSNWLDCGDKGGPQDWHSGSPGDPGIAECNFYQASDTDPVTGQVVTVLDMKYLNSYDSINPNCAIAYSTACQEHIETVPNNGESVPVGGVTFPMNMYIESVVRVTPDNFGTAYSTGGGNEGPWSWSYPTSEALEIDDFETSVANNSANGNYHNHGSASGPGIMWTNYGTPADEYLPAGYTMEDYHKYGALITTDGATAGYVCLFVDDILQHESCTNAGIASGTFNERLWWILTVGPTHTPSPGNWDQYVKYVRIWSCANWNAASTPTNECNGPTPSQNGNLIYWHQ